MYMGTHDFGIKAALIGCGSDRQRALSPREDKQVVSIIAEMLRTEGWSAWPKSKDKDFRRALSKKINASLKTSFVRDVYLHSFSAAE